MRNAKLRKQIDVAEIPELTQENIDNLEDVTGTVNPSKVSFGGPEVLKDWTTISGSVGGGIELTDGLLLENLEGVRVEYNASASAGVSGELTGRVVARTSGRGLPLAKGIDIEISKLSGNAPGYVNGGIEHDYIGSYGSSDRLFEIRGFLDLICSTSNAGVKYCTGTSRNFSHAEYLGNWYGARKTEVFFSAGSAENFNELWLEDGLGNITEFSYRIMRK
jgi:hypothetical protein